MPSYTIITSYLEHLKTIHSLDVTIKDYSGFIYTSENLERVIRPYLAHSSPYCMFIKETEKGYQRCLAQNRPLYEKCKQRKPFFGYCPAGICELVIPIASKGKVYGSINVSNFSLQEGRGDFLRDRLMKGESDARKVTARFLYQQFVRHVSVDIKEIQFSLELLGEFIVEIVRNAKGNETEKKVEVPDEKKIRTYIAENMSQKILAPHVVKACCITRSALNSCIENSNAKNFREFVNIIRIEQSEKLLLETDTNPREIATSLGFKDYNHFCRLFQEQVKIFPSDYQKYYKNEKHQREE
ncbi:MAG: helix-turn-helix domain-containing protein [Sphaerochaeta sp.]|nr:helix-turn-helix domain-containing protein [Sphaerochaeta sp.]